MGNNKTWRCDKIIQKIHRVSQKEIEQRLAELWEILLQGRSQFTRSPVCYAARSQGPFGATNLLPPKRSKR